VLLASGAAVPISQLRAGDKVLATSTRTGKTQPEVVTAVLVHHDSGLYDLTVDDHGRAVLIATTSSHLFWVPAPAGHSGWWVKAAALRYSDRLRTPDGSAAIVTGGWAPKTTSAWMWDLTVPGSNDHDFYVLAGSTAVLVHNCGTGSDGDVTPVSIYRSPKIADKDYELANGPNAASHQDGDASVYFGEQSVAAEYQGRGGYANGSIRYDMDPGFLDQFSGNAFRYDWQGPGGSARIEWTIPVDQLDQFNQLTLNRVWEPAGSGG
jgi:hypothetical protein